MLPKNPKPNQKYSGVFSQISYLFDKHLIEVKEREQA